MKHFNTTDTATESNIGVKEGTAWLIYWFPSVEVRQWDVVHLDFTIAFDSVCQERIVMKQRGRSLWAQPSLVKPHSATSQVRPFDSQPPTNPTAAATS